MDVLFRLIAIAAPLCWLAWCVHILRIRIPDVDKLPTVTGPVASTSPSASGRGLLVRLDGDPRVYVYGGQRGAELSQQLQPGVLVTISVSTGKVSQKMGAAGIARMQTIHGSEVIPFSEVIGYTLTTLRRYRVYAVLGLLWLLVTVWLVLPR